ncbi:hypothetical protein, conserved [Plasmodium gonderi]|uniref:Uncharacterized protein n=1 Tax=Plasmodium gonderi TaxID=77519 RepID=A0A1Y1JE10_PLAGO|nr:hypothetical protein, conserved [Plasmodium gonderi]GAW80736.1 hypothetical protein, conserved [Plasmodium gonderi]
MASRLTSLLCSVGKLPCDGGEFSPRKCSYGNINLCSLGSVSLNKGRPLNETLNTSNTEDVYNCQNSRDMYNCQNSPDMYNCQNSPDMYNCQNSPDVYNYQYTSDVHNYKYSPDVHNYEYSPDVHNYEYSPDVHNYEYSPDVHNYEYSPDVHNYEYSPDVHNYEYSPDVHKCQNSSNTVNLCFNRCIKKDLTCNIERYNINVGKICPGFSDGLSQNNCQQEEEDTGDVIELDDEVLIGNFPYGCLQEAVENSLITLEDGTYRVISDANLMTNQKDSNLSIHNIKISGKNPSHLYNEIVKPKLDMNQNSIGKESIEMDFTHKTNECNMTIGDSAERKMKKKKKKNHNNTKKKNVNESLRNRILHSMFGSRTKGERSASNSSLSCREKPSDASSEFLSVISGMKG